MPELREFELGSPGLDYVDKCLHGGLGLCAGLLRLPLQRGRVFAPLPLEMTEAQARNFESGALRGGLDRAIWIANHFWSLFDVVPGGTFIVRMFGARPDDLPSQFVVSRQLFTENEVYFVVTRHDESPQAIIEALKDPASFLVVGAFSRFELPQRRSKAPEIIADSVIEQIAKQTLEIVVSAYDQEGFVVWQRR